MEIWTSTMGPRYSKTFCKTKAFSGRLHVQCALIRGHNGHCCAGAARKNLLLEGLHITTLLFLPQILHCARVTHLPSAFHLP